MKTVTVAPTLWCRWSTQAEALLLDGDPTLPGTDSGAHLALGTPPWRRREHHAGRRLLVSLLRDVTPGAAGPLVIASRGKPALRDRPDIGISISHSFPMVAVAVGSGLEVGVDVELPPPATAHRTDVERLWAWTVREACVKVTGAGLAARPWRIPVDGTLAGTWHDIRWRVLRDTSPVPLGIAWRPCAPERAQLLTIGGSHEICRVPGRSGGTRPLHIPGMPGELGADRHALAPHPGRHCVDAGWRPTGRLRSERVSVAVTTGTQTRVSTWPLCSWSRSAGSRSLQPCGPFCTTRLACRRQRMIRSRP
jgi:4'-phosphopantetheinyl transferase